jgi:hypothetical protein
MIRKNGDKTYPLSGCFQNQIRDRVGLRYEGKMTGLDLDRLGAHALGHETLQVRVDCPVFRRHGIPAPLRPPSRIRCLVGKQRLFEGSLNGIEHARFVRRNVAGKVAQECFLAEPAFVVGPDNAGGGGWRWKAFGKRRVIFVRVGGARRDIDDGRHFRVDPGFGDDHAAEGMRHENRWTLLHGQDPLHCLYARLQARQRILHGGHLHAPRLQSRDHLRPTRAIGK